MTIFMIVVRGILLLVSLHTGSIVAAKMAHNIRMPAIAIAIPCVALVLLLATWGVLG